MKTCKICGSNEISILFNGKIRTGRFGELSEQDESVFSCPACHVAFLSSDNFKYETDDYRIAVEGKADPELFYKMHDKEQAEKINMIGTGNLRGRVIADIGCGGGAFLDFLSNVASETIAIEPCITYHKNLTLKGHKVFSSCKDFFKKCGAVVDIVTCFATIEHVENPLPFLNDIQQILKPGGKLLLSTPNHDDWLLEVVPEYKSFFYRKAHTFYFNSESLKYIASKSGFSKIEFEYKQQYNVANALTWIRDKRPGGNDNWTFLRGLDYQYREYLERIGKSNFIYLRAEKNI